MMICDIMILAKNLYNFDNICSNIDTNPKEYIRLTDHII